MSLFGYVDIHGVRSATKVDPKFPRSKVRKSEQGSADPEFSFADVIEEQVKDEKDEKDESKENLHAPIKSVSKVYEQAKEALNKRRPVIYAGDIMSRPIIGIREDDSLRKASSIFRKHRFRHLPVLSKEGVFVGLVSDRDLMRTMVENESEGKNKEIQVKDMMKTGILTANPELPIRTAAEVLLEKHLGVLPIMEEERLVGILTRTDILRSLIRQAPLELWI